jgi:hypothetical protein
MAKEDIFADGLTAAEYTSAGTSSTIILMIGLTVLFCCLATLVPLCLKRNPPPSGGSDFELGLHDEFEQLPPYAVTEKAPSYVSVSSARPYPSI